MIRWSGNCGLRLLMGQGDITKELHGKVINLFHNQLFHFRSSHLCSTVLQSMLTLITDKLQNQSLDDTASITSPPASQATFFKPPIPKEDVIKKPSTSKGLAVKGKNVWSMPFESAASGWNEKGENSSSGQFGKNCDNNLTVQLCCHKNSVNSCTICDTNYEIDPPKKKHCRSLSVPIDSMKSSPCHPDGTRLWRPIAVIPLTNNNIDQQNRNLSQRLSEFRPSCRIVTNFSRFVPSPVSMDSGHFTTSDFQTPPLSPVPRPASALSDFSHSSCGVPWLEQSPQKVNRFEILQNRSLSQDEQTQLGSGSTPCMFDSIYSNPSSPYRHKIPRCRSQPCVLHDRRSAKKRRRDDCRPTLNFQKMTETAYNRTPRSKPASASAAAGVQKPNSSFHDDFEEAINLMPIASSPLSTEIPVGKLSESYSVSGELVVEQTRGLQATPPPQSGDCSGYDIQQPVRLIGDEDAESGCGCRGDDFEDEGELFPLTDLDIEQIENH